MDPRTPCARSIKYAARLAHLLRTASNKITLVGIHDDTGLRHAEAFVGKAEVADYLRELSEKEPKPAGKMLQADSIGYNMEVRTATWRRIREAAVVLVK